MLKKAYCISYTPLLYGPPRVDLSEVGRDDPERLRELLSGAVSGLALGCAWVIHNSYPVPVLVYERGAEIYDHLVEWAEYDPPGWFRLYHAELPGDANEPPGYLVALQPRIDRSVERFKRSFPASFLDGATIEVVFSPLYIVATSTIYRDLRDRIGSTSLVGILDARDFDPNNPAVFKLDRIRPLGPFAVGDIDELGGAAAFLEGVVKFPG
jgi:hypothetical protein